MRSRGSVGKVAGNVQYFIDWLQSPVVNLKQGVIGKNKKVATEVLS